MHSTERSGSTRRRSARSRRFHARRIPVRLVIITQHVQESVHHDAQRKMFRRDADTLRVARQIWCETYTSPATPSSPPSSR